MELLLIFKRGAEVFES